MNPDQLYTLHKVRNEERLREAALVRKLQAAQDESSLGSKRLLPRLGATIRRLLQRRETLRENRLPADEERLALDEYEPW